MVSSSTSALSAAFDRRTSHIRDVLTGVETLHRAPGQTNVIVSQSGAHRALVEDITGPVGWISADRARRVAVDRPSKDTAAAAVSAVEPQGVDGR